MNEKLNESGVSGPDRLTLVHLKVSADGEVQRAVAYLRNSVQGFERVAALVEQQNALQRFAEGAGYDVVQWYVEGDGFEMDGDVLSQLREAAGVEDREFDVVLIWDYSRLSRNATRFAEIMRRLREQGVEVVFASENVRLAELQRQVEELADGHDDEVAC